MATCEILLPTRFATREIWLPARYCFRRDLATRGIWLPASDVIWLPERYVYPRDIASRVIWPPVRYACLQDVSYKRIPISSDLTYLTILTATWYGCAFAGELWLFEGMRKRAKSFNLVQVSISPNKKTQAVSIQYQEEAVIWICGCDLRG